MQAEAEVIPPFLDPLPSPNESEPGADEPCPMLVKIDFSLKDGFQLQQGKPLPCGTQHQVANISEDGAIAPMAYINPADQ